nr:2 N-acetylated-alpha-linked acidic dipeptidase 2-like protein 2 [Halisarca dujardinii]
MTSDYVTRPRNTMYGPLVYLNYGARSDYAVLSGLGINVTGCVCLARYGATFRGSQVKLAQENGCVGLVPYTDPEQFGPKEGHPAYPKGGSLPLSGVQRGTGVYRRPYEEAVQDRTVPSIPVTPISSGDALHFLRQLKQTHRAPDSWQGGLNSSYCIGPGFGGEGLENSLAYIEVNSYFENKTIVNVIGTIYGSQEPDRPILLGSHRDTWVLGAVDASGATATLMEIARALGQMRGRGWRPGRTITLASWDGSEYCMIGSTEYVEDKAKTLFQNAVAYINVDFCVSGTDFVNGVGTPLLIPVFYEAAKQVATPSNRSLSVYEELVQKVETINGRPILATLSADSDYTPFIQSIGVSSMAFTYSSDPKTSPYTFYAMYHSLHDTFSWMKKFIDSDFTYHLAIGQLWLRAALVMATSPILPFGVIEYGDKLSELASSLNETFYDTLVQKNISLNFLFESVAFFKSSAFKLQTAIEYVKSQHFNEATRLKLWRVLNAKLIGVERAFIVPEGLPGRPHLKHAVFAPSQFNNYKTSSFPGVTDALVQQDWCQARRQVSVAGVCIRSAADIMSESLEAAIYVEVARSEKMSSQDNLAASSEYRSWG